MSFLFITDNFEAAVTCAEEIIAHVSKNPTQLAKLINYESKFEPTALIIAASIGNADLIQLLLKHGAIVTYSHRNETLFYFLAKLGMFVFSLFNM